jgi:hypothetical protein
MTGTPTCFKNPGIYSATVVTHAQTKLSRVVGDLCFDVFTIGMTKRIDDGLAPNAVALFKHEGM